jgi:Domain of unknown function DUF11
MRYRFAVVLAAVAALAAAGVGLTRAAAASPALPKADLTVAQTSDVTSASPHQVVTFTSFAVNLGPSDSQLDDVIQRQLGLRVTAQHCQNVSPDTPFCEFGVLPPYVPQQMVVRARVTGAIGTVATLTVCARNEGGQTDPVRVNNCSTTFVRIIAPPPTG